MKPTSLPDGRGRSPADKRVYSRLRIDYVSLEAFILFHSVTFLCIYFLSFQPLKANLAICIIRIGFVDMYKYKIIEQMSASNFLPPPSLVWERLHL